MDIFMRSATICTIRRAAGRTPERMVLEGDDVPEPYRGSLLMGSIHGCSIKRDVLRRNGSTFIASHAPDFLTSGDKNFRPINLRWGPDGSIYVIDWHDQNPCHQAQADSWDMTHGTDLQDPAHRQSELFARRSFQVVQSGVGAAASEQQAVVAPDCPPSVARTARRLHRCGPAHAAARYATRPRACAPFGR